MADNPVTTKSFALVGKFLQTWSHLEQTLHLGIAAATKLDPLMTTVVCANLTIREKLNMLRTLVDISTIEADRKATYKKLLRSISDYSPTRNMIAHDYFFTGEDQPAIGFFTVKAKGKFATSAVGWTEQDFEREYETMRVFQQEAMQLTIALEHTTFNADDLLLPMKLVGSSARQRRPSRPPEGDPDSRLAIPKTPPEASGEEEN